MHMLVATNGSQIAVDAACRAGRLFSRRDRVTLLTVLTTVPGENIDELDEPESPEDQARQWDIVNREADREFALTAAALSTSHVDTRVEAGDVAQTISRVAREICADVIVLGVHGHHRFPDVFRRSVAERVVRNAPCAVLVVPKRENCASADRLDRDR